MRIIPNNSDSDSNLSADSDASARTFGYLLVVFLFFVVGGWAVLAPIECRLSYGDRASRGKT